MNVSADPTISISFDGTAVAARPGQTIAGALIGSGVPALRTTSRTGSARGVFCGIGVCFDCIVTVNGVRDVRACQRRAQDGDVVTPQHDELPTSSGAGGDD